MREKVQISSLQLSSVFAHADNNTGNMEYNQEDLVKYSRLWDQIVMEANPRLWNRGVKLMRQTELWDKTASSPEFLDATDDEIASETKAVLCSDRGKQIFKKMEVESIAKEDFRKFHTWNRLESWLGEFWDFVESWLGRKSLSVANMTGKEAEKVTLEDIVDKTVLDFVSSKENAASPNVTIFTSLPFIKSKYEDLHHRAKSGDKEAANQLVSEVASPEKFQKIGLDHSDAILLPVIADEALGHNQLPMQLAAYASKASGLEVCTDIYQSVRARHTGASKIERFLRVPQFNGPVERGRKYVIIDDHSTQGSTISSLRQYIKDNGGLVVGYATLSASAGGTMPEISKEMLASLREKDKDGKLEEAVRTAYGFPRGFEDLTHGQARFLSVASNAEEVKRNVFESSQDVARAHRLRSR